VSDRRTLEVWYALPNREVFEICNNWLPALQQETYTAVVPTLEDSSGSDPHYTEFVVTAHTTTPPVWYVSLPDSGYSIDNIAPAAPTSLAVAYNTGSGNHLTWDASPAEDFQYFNVYRSEDPNFDPSLVDPVGSTAGTSWSDTEKDGWPVYYKVTAVDHVGNESGPASPVTTTGIGDRATPKRFALYQNTPNPFNPTTLIRYDIPEGGRAVTLAVYDVGGRLVRTLVDGVETPGEKTVSWDGHDSDGRTVASGVYFYRLTSTSYTETRKMLLMK
jgi:fibronectin type 3 domain-containing protein